MGRKKLFHRHHQWCTHLNDGDNLKLERLLVRLHIGGETKSEKLRLLIRKLYDTHFGTQRSSGSSSR